MAGGGDTDQDQKTHDPSAKRIEDAHKKGDVATAPEVRMLATFLGTLVVVSSLGAYTVERMASLAVRLWGNAEDYRLEPTGAENFAIGLFGKIADGLLPALGVLFVFALLGGLLQARPLLAWTRLKPQWSKLNPASGFKRQFGGRAMMEFAKTLAKLLLIGGVAFYIAWPKAAAIDRLVGIDPADIGPAALGVVLAMLKPIAMLVGALALFDVIWQRRAWMKKMRMSLQELKDEHKESEGDPKIKGKIRQLQLQRSRSRMMANVPKASVVITNPTHYAVALQYDHGVMVAPVVVAKGVDALALKIRAIATEHNIPIVENVPLARALYAATEIDHPIPVEHFSAVAEVISYVLRLARKRG